MSVSSVSPPFRPHCPTSATKTPAAPAQQASKPVAPPPLTQALTATAIMTAAAPNQRHGLNWVSDTEVSLHKACVAAVQRRGR